MTSKSKTSTANVVTTTNGEKFRVTDKLVRSTNRRGYFSPKQELYHALYQLFLAGNSEIDVTAYVGQYGRHSWLASKDETGSLAIGCTVFNAANTKKLARLVGFSSAWLKLHWPTRAQAAAAGR